LPTETEIVSVKLIIQSEKSAHQKVEDALTRGKEAYDASIMEAETLEATEVAAIWERYDAQKRRITASWNRKRAELREQLREIEARLARQREVLAPVKWLPSEVLSEIFTIHVDCGNTPWTLLYVCRLWKAVGSSTPRIWRYIQICEVNKEQGRFNSGTSFQMCFTNSQFEKALSRTGATPLSISIAVPYLAYSTDLAPDTNRLFAVFVTLTKILNRCDTIELKETYRSFSKECQNLFATLQFPVSSPVRCLHVGGGWESSIIVHKILVASNHGSSALRELSMAAHGNPSLFDSLTNYPTLLNRSPHSPPKIARSRQMSSPQCVASPTSLNQTTFSHFPQASNVFNLLQEAQFLSVNVRVLDTHEFGKLRKLVLRNCVIPATIQPGAIKVPVLDTLIFEGSSWLPILVFDCPSVSHLELEGGWHSKADAKREVDQIWGPGQKFTHLRELKIDLVMSDTVLTTILKRSVALELLFITVSGVNRAPAPGDTFFNSLLVKNPRRLGFLQNLRTLILQTEYDSLKSESVLAGLRARMQRVVHSRQGSAPLLSATLQVIERGWDGVPVLNKEEFVVCEEM
jgi:hypothetical protein